MRIITLMIAAMSLLLSCGGSPRNKATGNNEKKAPSETPRNNKKGDAVQYMYKIKKTYPHSEKSYTQGLYWQDGYLYEGTGLNGRSELMKVELESGKIVQKVGLEEKYFGEGIALLDGNIYQLTWQDGKAFVYDATTFKRTGQIEYRGEGWGLTADGKELYMSDGSDKIYVVDKKTFQKQRTISVTLNGRKMHYLNELEWINGEIWANVYLSEVIVKIDPTTGKVTGVIDMSGLLAESDKTYDTDVLNGIAYDGTAKRIFVTGKNWNKLFEIEIVEK